MSAHLDRVRNVCLALPGATETIQWECLVFKVTGKIFALTQLEPSATWLTFKCTTAEFAELTERPGIIQAPYFARNQWVALETPQALRSQEWEERLRRSYELVVEKLPRKLRATLTATTGLATPGGASS